MQDPPLPPPPAPPGAPPPSSEPEPLLPWDDRSRLGFFPAMVETIRMLVTEPGRAFSRLRRDGDYLGPILFGGLIAWVAAIVSQIWSSLFSGFFAGFAGSDQLWAAGGWSAFQIGVVLFFFPVFYLIGVFIGAGIYHLCLMMVGGLGDSSFGFEGTFKVVSYSQVSSLANLIPIVGALIALVAQVILLVVGFQKAHRASQGQAVVAALLPLLLCCLCVVLVFTLGIGAMMAGLSSG